MNNDFDKLLPEENSENLPRLSSGGNEYTVDPESIFTTDIDGPELLNDDGGYNKAIRAAIGSNINWGLVIGVPALSLIALTCVILFNRTRHAAIEYRNAPKTSLNATPTPIPTSANPWDNVPADDTTNPLSAHYKSPDAIDMNRDARNDYSIRAEDDSKAILTIDVTVRNKDGDILETKYAGYAPLTATSYTRLQQVMTKAAHARDKNTYTNAQILNPLVDEHGNALDSKVIPLVLSGADANKPTIVMDPATKLKYSNGFTPARTVITILAAMCGKGPGVSKALSFDEAEKYALAFSLVHAKKVGSILNTGSAKSTKNQTSVLPKPQSKTSATEENNVFSITEANYTGDKTSFITPSENWTGVGIMNAGTFFGRLHELGFNTPAPTSLSHYSTEYQDLGSALLVKTTNKNTESFAIVQIKQDCVLLQSLSPDATAEDRRDTLKGMMGVFENSGKSVKVNFSKSFPSKQNKSSVAEDASDMNIQTVSAKIIIPRPLSLRL